MKEKVYKVYKSLCKYKRYILNQGFQQTLSLKLLIFSYMWYETYPWLNKN